MAGKARPKRGGAGRWVSRSGSGLLERRLLHRVAWRHNHWWWWSGARTELVHTLPIVAQQSANVHDVDRGADRAYGRYN